MNGEYQCPLTSAAISYAWGQLARRAGLSADEVTNAGTEILGTPVYYVRPDWPRPDGPGIIVVPCEETAFCGVLDRSPNSLDWLSSKEAVPPGIRPPFERAVPVLFWGQGYERGNKPFAERTRDGSVVFYADIVAATMFMLSRWEERTGCVRDQHGRFPASASVAQKQGFLDQPVIDQYALLLRAWLMALLPRWRPIPRAFSARLTHDVDHMRRFQSHYAALRNVGGDLLKRHDPKRAWETSVNAVRQRLAPDTTSYFRGIHTLSTLSNRFGLESAFYFMAVDPRLRGQRYDIESPSIRRCVHNLRSQGFQIGLHASYDSLNDPNRLAEEKGRLDSVLGETRYGGRQHFLRFRVPDTWRHWEQAGLTYDSTMGYPDCEGFRCGTCHPFRPFDVERDREFNLLEWPLIVTDVTLRTYREMTPEEGEARILELARRCREVEGTLTLVWHNSSLDGQWEPWAQAYTRVVEKLGADVHARSVERSTSPHQYPLMLDVGQPKEAVTMKRAWEDRP